MVMAGRESGRAEYEREVAERAARNNVSAPIYTREEASRVLREAKVSVVTPPDATRPPKKVVAVLALTVATIPSP
jgi:hypothetical protein